jgi:hypothetical protein
MAKERKITVAKSALIFDAQEKIATTLGNLKPDRRMKVLKAVCILLDIKLDVQGRP